MPPEVLLNEKYGINVDVWACSIIFVELLTGSRETFFKGFTKEEILTDIFYKKIDLPLHTSRSTVDLIKGLFSLNSEERPTFENLLKHPLI